MAYFEQGLGLILTSALGSTLYMNERICHRITHEQMDREAAVDRMFAEQTIIDFNNVPGSSNPFVSPTPIMDWGETTLTRKLTRYNWYINAVQQGLVGIEAGSLNPWDQLSEDAQCYWRHVARNIMRENVDEALQRAGGLAHQGVQENWFEITSCWHDIMLGLGTTLFVNNNAPIDVALITAASEYSTWSQTELYRRWWFRIWCLNALLAAGYV